ncbi:MAG: hypothetical protein P4L85_21265 [Paludisphaera borealis]|uniref:hypothetical protein n=1 Tax=Paludisphaera borealis TaxID=1387353 RepID=UPI00283DBB34|nr:hypothetical protein [Paludisphaera borealis]MDR3621895.1 hypothetical protein [Paludisphaera borealis]
MPSPQSLAVRTPWRIELPVDDRVGREVVEDASPDEDVIAASAANDAEARRILAWFGLCLASRARDRIDELGFLDDGTGGGPPSSTEADSVARPWM